LFNPTPPKLTKLTQKLYTTFPLRSRTLHKHFKPMYTALPQPPSLLKKFLSSFVKIHFPNLFPKSQKIIFLFESFFYLPQHPICSLSIPSSFIYIHTSFFFPQKNSLAPLYPLTLLTPSFFCNFCNSSIAVKLTTSTLCLG